MLRVVQSKRTVQTAMTSKSPFEAAAIVTQQTSHVLPLAHPTMPYIAPLPNQIPTNAPEMSDDLKQQVDNSIPATKFFNEHDVQAYQHALQMHVAAKLAKRRCKERKHRLQHLLTICRSQSKLAKQHAAAAKAFKNLLYNKLLQPSASKQK